MVTGLSAVRSGVVMFVLPFVFAFYPELLIIDAAKIDPTSIGGKEFLLGYSSGVNWSGLAEVLARLSLALYLLASALSKFDRLSLQFWEVAARLILAILVINKSVIIFGPAIVISILWLVWHWQVSSRKAAAN